jgi:UDP-N-acetylmuramate--alanine ligase
VVEADEFDRSFLTLAPVYALVTSLDADHLDTYGTMRALAAAFLEFLDRVPFHGRAIWCADHPRLARLVRRSRAPLTSYGLSPRSRVRGLRVRTRGLSTELDLARDGARLGALELQVPGRLNAENAVGAAALALELGVPFAAIRDALAEFRGVARRFELKVAGPDVLIVDDYAHHPAEVRATIRAARDGWRRRVLALFQPHLYSRTRDLAGEFGEALALADCVLVADVYGSRERPIPGVDGSLVADAVRAAGRTEVAYVADRAALTGRALERIRPGDLVLVMGAGDIGEVADEIAGRLAGESSAGGSAAEGPWSPPRRAAAPAGETLRAQA